MIYQPIIVSEQVMIEDLALAIGQDANEQAFFPGLVQVEIAQVLTNWVMDAYTRDAWHGGMYTVAAQPGAGKSVFAVGY